MLTRKKKFRPISDIADEDIPVVEIIDDYEFVPKTFHFFNLLFKDSHGFIKAKRKVFKTKFGGYMLQ